MVDGINSSKKQYFIWLSVFLVLFLGIMTLMLIGNAKDEEFFANAMETFVGVFVIPYVIATLPMGWAIRRKFMYWYAHVPTEEIVIFESNILLAMFRLMKCAFLAGLNLDLFAIYFLVSILVGIFFTPYFIISGIVLMVKKKI